MSSPCVMCLVPGEGPAAPHSVLMSETESRVVYHVKLCLVTLMLIYAIKSKYVAMIPV